ncbi:MAG: LPS export ABC transporter periplasmic protein LptC [Candidatus Omnitrophota bacterium]|nr:LPS export ABC transporter periplasmic protein LptC [Candidatus Omnitrophota bacterium]
MHKKIILAVGFLFYAGFFCRVSAQQPPAPAEQSDQQIGDFSLSGYGERGKKSWDLAGKTADIFIDTVKLNDVTGNLYGKEEDIRLTADRGNFNKTDGKVRMEKNVVITTSSGTRLTTDSLDWDRKNQVVATKDPVNIQRANMVIDAIGAKGEPSLKKVALEKEVKLDINPTEADKLKGKGPEEKIEITCDGPLEIDYQKNIASFYNNVKVTRQGSEIYSDKMFVYFIPGKKEEEKEEKKEEKEDEKKASGEGAGLSGDMMGSSIDKIIARGNVKVVRGENVSYSEEAIYNAVERKITLSGKPKLIIYSTEDMKNAPLGG